MTSSYEEVKEYSKLLNGDLTNKTIGVFKTVIDEVENEELKAQFNALVSKLEEKKELRLLKWKCQKNIWN